MYQVSSSTVFFFVSYMHIHVPLMKYCSRLFVVVFQEVINMVLFVGSQIYISKPSFMFVSAAVSELNRNKKKEKENSYSNLTPFLGI